MKLNKINNVKGLFITGTDTGVGKTYISQKILQQLSAQSISCVAMKPVASGAVQTEHGLRNADALTLQSAANVDVPYELLNPYCFEPAIAPHLAAQQSGVVIDQSVIIEAFESLSRLADVVIVEGVGGWSVPLNTKQSLSVASLAEQLQLPVVLVVALRLGCINHALLSCDAIANSQCDLLGWIANNCVNNFNTADECVSTLQDQIVQPLLANFPCHDGKDRNDEKDGRDGSDGKSSYAGNIGDKNSTNSVATKTNDCRDTVFDLEQLLLNS